MSLRNHLVSFGRYEDDWCLAVGFYTEKVLYKIYTKFDTITEIVCLLRKILLNFFIDFYVVDVEFCVIKIARSFGILRNCTQLVAVYNWNSNVKSAEVFVFPQLVCKDPQIGHNWRFMQVDFTPNLNTFFLWNTLTFAKLAWIGIFWEG